MMLHLCFGIVLALGGAAFQADGTHGPRIALDRMDYDFGSIMQDEEKDVTITVRNSGDEPLRISHVKNTCGCALSDPWKDVTLPPGGSKEMNIKLSSKSNKYFGKLRKSILLYSNDPVRSVTTVWVNLEIKADYWPEKRMLTFQNITLASKGEQTILIRSFMEKPLELRDIRCAAPFIRTRFREVAPLDPGKGYALYALDVEVDGTKIGRARNRINTMITFKPNSERIQEDNILVSILFLPENIIITPDSLVLDHCFQGESRESEIRFKHDEGKEFILSEAQSSSPYLKTKVEKKGPGESVIRVTLSDRAPVGVLRAEIRVVIDYMTSKTVSIPVRCLVSPKAGEEPPRH